MLYEASLGQLICSVVMAIHDKWVLPSIGVTHLRLSSSSIVHLASQLLTHLQRLVASELGLLALVLHLQSFTTQAFNCVCVLG